MAFAIRTTKGIRELEIDELQALHEQGKLPGTTKIRRLEDDQVLTVAEALRAVNQTAQPESPRPLKHAEKLPRFDEDDEDEEDEEDGEDPFAAPRSDDEGPRRKRGGGHRSYQSPRGRAQIATVFLILNILLGIGAIVSSMMQLDLLARDYSEAEADINDQREQTVMYASLILYFITVVFFARWILAANRNALRWNRRLTIKGGWSVGYYFIPILHLWKPAQSMSEMFRSSRAPSNIVTIWWAMWIGSIVFGKVVSAMYRSASSIPSLRTATQADIGLTVFNIILTGVAILLIWTLTNAQDAMADVPPDDGRRGRRPKGGSTRRRRREAAEFD